MSTSLADLVAIIGADFFNRSDLNAKIKNGIRAAIRHYERERWPWNEGYTAIAATSGHNYVALPSDALVIDLLQVNIDGQATALIRKPFDWIRQANVALTPGAPPTHYAIYQDRIWLFATPNSATTLPCYYLQQLPLLSADADTNAWLNEAQNLVMYHAAKVVWATTLRNDAEATKYAQMESGAYSELNRFRNQRQRGRITPTSF